MRKHFLIFLSTMLIMFGLGGIYPTYRPVVSDTLGERAKAAVFLVTADAQRSGFAEAKLCCWQEMGQEMSCGLVQPELFCWVAWLSSQVLFYSEQFLFTGN